MITAVCTLFEGVYHYGVGSLVNSLYLHGFRGVVWAGYRGALPPWAKSLKDGQDYQEFFVAEGCVIRFVELTTRKFLNNYKSDFMLRLWESHCSNVESLFYFDPDIINKCRWGFYEEWVSRGVTLCEDAYPDVPYNHPCRLGWQEFSESHGYTCHRKLDRYYNAGFIGLKQSQKSMLSIWQQLLETCEAAGGFSLSEPHFNVKAQGRYVYPYISDDQDALNLALMLTLHPLSTFGPEGMDFGKPGGIMSHAAVSFDTKPWKKQFVRKALGGQAPSLSDKLYVQHAQTPIQLYSQLQQFWKKLGLYCASAIGRFIRRV